MNHVKIKCTGCGKMNKVPIEDEEVFEPVGKPQLMGAINCPVCNKRIAAWLTIIMRKESAGTHAGVNYID